MTPRRQAPLLANGRFRAEEASPAGPAREGATGGHGARDVASHARLAELYGALAEEHARLAGQGQVQLAAGAERALMSLVPATATEALPAAPFDPPDPREFERLLSVQDLADRLGVDPKTVRRWRRDRVLPEALVVGGVVRWRPAMIDAWLASRGGQQ